MTSQTDKPDPARDGGPQGDAAAQDLDALNRASDSVIAQLGSALRTRLGAVPAWLKILIGSALAVVIPICIAHA